MNDTTTTFSQLFDSEQLALDIEPLIIPERVVGQTIQEKFEAFHALNPWVYRALVRLTADWVARGRTRIGMKMLTEVLRWEYGRQTVGDEFKINNNFTSRYVRLLVSEHPEFADAFHTRELRAA